MKDEIESADKIFFEKFLSAFLYNFNQFNLNLFGIFNL